MGLCTGHRGANTELACFIRSRGHHPAHRGSANDDRQATQRWIIELFDRGVKGVHIGMGDDAIPSAAREIGAGMGGHKRWASALTGNVRQGARGSIRRHARLRRYNQGCRPR
jgi:hypothetical protein